MGYVYILLTVAFTVYGQLIIKHQVNLVAFPADGPELLGFIIRFCFRPLVMSGLGAAVLASFAWMAALSKFDLSYAYPFMSLNFVLVVFVSIVIFGEVLDFYKVASLCLIVAGVYQVGQSSNVRA